MAKSALRMLCVAAAFWAGAPHARLPDPEELVALLRAQKYAELDARVGAYQAAYEANTDAEWALIVAIGAFERIEPELEPLHGAWIQSQPKSYVARLARAAHWYQRAWASRGERNMDKTAPERAAMMQRYFDQCAADLKASAALSKRAQLSHRYLISVGMARGMRQQVNEGHVAALRADPEAYASRRAYLNALRPQWGGSIQEMSRVLGAAESAPQTPKMALVVKHLRASILGYRALQAERNREYPVALNFYAEGLAQIEDPILLANRGALLRRLKRDDEALRDFDRAIALDPNSGDAYERRGVLYELRKRNKEAVRDYTRAAVYGETYATSRLGLIYLYGGSGVQVNDMQALRWLKLGAEYGDDSAQATLGYMYASGRGGVTDGRKAYALWRASAAQGNEEAQRYLDEASWLWKARFALEDLFGN